MYLLQMGIRGSLPYAKEDSLERDDPLQNLLKKSQSFYCGLEPDEIVVVQSVE